MGARGTRGAAFSWMYSPGRSASTAWPTASKSLMTRTAGVFQAARRGAAETDQARLVSSQRSPSTGPATAKQAAAGGPDAPASDRNAAREASKESCSAVWYVRSNSLPPPAPHSWYRALVPPMSADSRVGPGAWARTSAQRRRCRSGRRSAQGRAAPALGCVCANMGRVCEE